MLHMASNSIGRGWTARFRMALKLRSGAQSGGVGSGFALDGSALPEYICMYVCKYVCVYIIYTHIYIYVGIIIVQWNLLRVLL